MKTLIIVLVFAFALCYSNISIAQDIIFLRDGKELNCKVIGKKLDKIYYKIILEDNNKEIEGFVPENAVVMIKYESGENEIFDNAGVQQTPIVLTETNYCDKGFNDASQNYRFSSGKTLWPTILLSPLGLGFAIGFSSSTPKDENLKRFANTEHFKNEEYKKCFRDEAFKIKKRKAWTGFGIGMAINVGVFLILASGSE
jgi:hypothetical protein